MDKLYAKLLRNEKGWKNLYSKKNFRKKIRTYISKSKKHLDFGCGFGFLTFLLAKDYSKAKFYGIDTNKKCIRLGKQRYQKSNLHLKSACKINGKFDSISAFSVVHHIKRSADFLKMLYDHLNSNGIIIVIEFRKAPKLRFRIWYNKKVKESEYKETFEKSYKEHNRWTTKQFISLMEKNGFKTLEVKSVDTFRFLYVGKKYNQ